MYNSILNSMKKMLGLTPDYEPFDVDILIHINSIFSTLTQLGVGPKEGFSISDENTTWEDYLQDNAKLNKVKTYMYLKLKLVFDPHTSASVLAAYEREIKELEWRITVDTDE